MKKLTPAQKASVHKAALREVANLLENDWGDPFKDRELPDEFADRDDDLWRAADEHFFACIKTIAKEMRLRAK